MAGMINIDPALRNACVRLGETLGAVSQQPGFNGIHETTPIPSPEEFRGLIAHSGREVRHPLLGRVATDPLHAFEQQFRSLSHEQQKRVYDESIRLARSFCRDVLEEFIQVAHNSNAQGEDTRGFSGQAEPKYPFAFAEVPFSDFELINKLYVLMDSALGNEEGVRFYGSEDRYVFGLGKDSLFNGVPVIEFVDIWEEYKDDPNGFVHRGKKQIFIMMSRLGETLLEMREFEMGKTLWSYVDDPRSFDEAAKQHLRLRTLAHEYGHIRQFHHDPRVAQIPNQFVESYAEIFGVLEWLADKKDVSSMILELVHMLFKLDWHGSPTYHSHHAAAHIPLYLENITVDHEHRSIEIDFDGFRESVDALRAFFFEELNVAGEREKRSRFQLLLRNRALELAGIEMGVSYRLASMIECELSQCRKNLLSMGEEERERRIASWIPGLEDGMRLERDARELARYAKAMLGFEEDVAPHQSSETKELKVHEVLPFMYDMNEALRLREVMSEQMWLVRMERNAFTMLNFDYNVDAWSELHSRGYLDADGVVQPSFDEDFAHVELPWRLDRARAKIIDKVQSWRNRVEEERGKMLSSQELKAHIGRLDAIKNTYPNAERLVSLYEEITKKCRIALRVVSEGQSQS